MMKSLIPFFFQTNLYSAFPHMSLVVCFIHLLALGQDKLSANATKCVFLSYFQLQLQLGYHCYSLNTHRYFVSVDVTFFKNSFMFPITHPPNSNVISLPLLYLVSDTLLVPPATPPRSLQVYTRRPHTNTEPPTDPSPMAPSTTLVLSSPVDLLIAIRKGTRFSYCQDSFRSSSPIYSYYEILAPVSFGYQECLPLW